MNPKLQKKTYNQGTISANSAQPFSCVNIINIFGKKERRYVISLYKDFFPQLFIIPELKQSTATMVAAIYKVAKLLQLLLFTAKTISILPSILQTLKRYKQTLFIKKYKILENNQNHSDFNDTASLKAYKHFASEHTCKAL